METKILLIMITLLFLQNVYGKSKKSPRIKSDQENKKTVKEHVQEVFSADNIDAAISLEQIAFDGAPISKEKVFDIAKALVGNNTPEGQMIDKIDKLLQPNEIDVMRDAMQKEYDQRKLQQKTNPIIDQLNNFEMIVLQIINQYLEAVSDIKNVQKKIKNDIDLKPAIIYFKNIFEHEGIENNPANIDFLIDLYCIIDAEGDLYKPQELKFLSDISLNEYYFRIENYMTT